MKRWQRCAMLGIGLLILPLVLTGIVGYTSAHLRLDFCRELVAYGDGYVGIQEGLITTSIFQIDKTDRMTGLIRSVNLDMSIPQVKSFEQLFQDEKGTLYVSATLHGKERHEDQVIYRVDMQKQTLTRVWKIRQSTLEGSILDGQRYSVMDGRLYFTVLEPKEMRLVTYSMAPGGTPQEVAAQTCQSCKPAACIYTPEGLVSLYRDQGVFLQNDRLYPAEGTSRIVLDGLSYDGGVVSFVDQYRQQIVCMEAASGEISQKGLGDADATTLENVHITKDGKFSACVEQQDGTLTGAYWYGTSLWTISSLRGPLQWGWMGQCFAATLLAELAAAALAGLLLWAERRNRPSGQKRFLSVRARISILSVGMVLLCTVVVSVVLIRSVSSYSRQRQQFNASNAASVFIGVVVQNRLASAETDGSMEFSDDFLEMLHQWAKSHKDSGSLYDYQLFAYDQEWFCIYSADQVRMVPAKYVVDPQTIQRCQEAADTKLLQTFQQVKSQGVQNCSISPGNQNWKTPMVSMATTDGYDQRAEILTTVLDLIRVSVVVCIILLLAENILIWLSMRRLSRLNQELAGSDLTGTWKITDFPGEDEIAETAQAMKVMTSSIQQSLREIRVSNDQYERLIPKDAIRLMGADSFVQVQAGQTETREALLLLLAFHSASDQWIRLGMQTIRDCGGLLLNFDEVRMTCCFQQKEDLIRCLKTLLRDPAWSGNVTPLFSPGTLQIGVVGNDSVKRVLVLSKRGKQLRRISNQVPYQTHLGFCFDPDVLDLDRELTGYAVRLAGWQDETPYYELIAAEEDLPQYREREAFERALQDYRQGRYQEAQVVFRRLRGENDQDPLAAYYDEACRREMGGKRE